MAFVKQQTSVAGATLQDPAVAQFGGSPKWWVPKCGAEARNQLYWSEKSKNTLGINMYLSVIRHNVTD